jgi:hypothetical protein
MQERPLTQRERAVLDALLAADCRDAEILRPQAADVVVVGTCGCGCPSIDFARGRGLGMTIQVDARVGDSYDGLFLYSIEDPQRGAILGGLEWTSVAATSPAEFPAPDLLDIRPA